MKTYPITTTKAKFSYWLQIGLIASVIFIIRCLFGLTITAYSSVIVSIISAFLWALLLVSWLWKK